MCNQVLHLFFSKSFDISIIWFEWECTPPSLHKPSRWTVLFLLWFNKKFWKLLFFSISLLSKALFIFGRVCSTTLPEPRFIWPTSEFPTWSIGKPTSAPDASRVEYGNVLVKKSTFGVFANATALFSVFSLIPQPSIIHKTIGFFFVFFIN